MNVYLALKGQIFMKILAVDSSAKAVSAAIIEDKKLLSEFFVNVNLTHSQTLLPMIEDILKNTMLKVGDVDAFAVSTGPGSFTGLRIGIAAIKGMAFTNEIPCIEVSTLHSMAYNFMGENVIVCAVMDARRNQVYNAIFEVCDEKITRLTPDRTISIDELYFELEKLEKKVFFVGDGAILCYNNYKNNLNLRLAFENKRFQRASSVAFAAFDSYLNAPEKIINSVDLSPKYLRLPQAERELLDKKIL